jgi:hypothetical protein
MSLIRKLKKFSIIPALVFAPFILKGQNQETSSVRELYYPNGVSQAYREALIKDFISDINLEAGSILVSQQNDYLRSNFPTQYGAELTANKKINKNISAQAFFTIFKGNNNQEIYRELSGSTMGLGVELHKGIDFGGGLIYKDQEITGPRNGFPHKSYGFGFYLQGKKEFKIIPNELDGYFGLRSTQIKEIGQIELRLGLILKPK